jgi:peroxisomal membrane protein 4
VFGRSRSSVAQQIVIYVFARVAVGLAKLAFKPRGTAIPGGGVYTDVSRGGWGLVRDEKAREVIERNAWPVFASLSWATVMWLFWWHPDVVQPSLRSSMNYMWVSFPLL